MPLNLGHRGVSSIQPTGQVRDSTLIGKTLISTGDGMSQGNIQNFGQHINTFLVDNIVRVKSERIPDPSSEINPFSEQFGHVDLMSALLNQVGSSFLLDPKYLCFLIVFLIKFMCVSVSTKALDRLKMSLTLTDIPSTIFLSRIDPASSLSNCSCQCK